MSPTLSWLTSSCLVVPKSLPPISRLSLADHLFGCPLAYWYLEESHHGVHCHRVLVMFEGSEKPKVKGYLANPEAFAVAAAPAAVIRETIAAPAEEKKKEEEGEDESR